MCWCRIPQGGMGFLLRKCWIIRLFIPTKFDKVITVDPMNERAYIGKAEAYAGMGEYGQAAAAYAVAVQTMPNGNDVWNAAEQQAEEVQRASSMVGLPFYLADLLVIKVFLLNQKGNTLSQQLSIPQLMMGCLKYPVKRKMIRRFSVRLEYGCL